MVQLGSADEAADAITKLNGQTPAGFEGPVSVSFANAGKSKGKGAGKDKGWAPPAAAVKQASGNMTLQVQYAGNAATPCDNLYITGLSSPQIDMPTLKLLFTSMGVKVVRTKVVPDTQG